MSDWPKQSELADYYGNPSGRNGLPSTKWESDNLCFVNIPWKAEAAWDASIKIKKIRVHQKCADSLNRILETIWRDANCSQATIESWGCHRIGGGYNYRAMRGSSRLSAHAYGCAIDLDPANNGMNDSTPNFARLPQVVRAFEAEGWEWGGYWSRPDGMHFQAARLG